MSLGLVVLLSVAPSATGDAVAPTGPTQTAPPRTDAPRVTEGGEAGPTAPTGDATTPPSGDATAPGSRTAPSAPTEPKTTEPKSTEPKTTEPKTTEPKTTDEEDPAAGTAPVVAPPVSAPPAGAPAPPAGAVTAPPAAAPPIAAPPAGAPPTVDPSAAAGAAEVVEGAASTAGRIGETIGSLRNRDEAADRGGDDPPPSDDETTTEREPPPEASEPTDADEVVYVDYTQSWHESPPPPEEEEEPEPVVVTHVVHVPPPPPPAPPPSYDPRAHGFVGLSVRGTTTNRNPSAMVGGRLGFTFDDRFTIGGAFYTLTARYAGPIIDSRGNELGMRMAYGGVLLAWTLYEGRVVHLGLESLAGAGAACISREKKYTGRWNCIEKVGLISLEPGVEVAFDVADWLRLGVTGGYRFITREAWRPPNDFTLSGPYVGLNVDFGWFGED